MVEVPVPETDEDAVRIMTIHAAKGREFPVVVLMGTSSVSNYKGEAVLFNRRNNHVEISVGTSSGPKFTTAGYEDAGNEPIAITDANRGLPSRRYRQ